MSESTGTLAKILIVDDDQDIRQAVSFLLKKEHYAVDCCAGGAEAVTTLKNGAHYDLIIMDMVMPVMTGSEAVREIRQFTSIPVLFLTAKSADSDKIEAYTAGGDDYLSKPFSGVELLLRVRALLKRYGGEGETLALDAVSRCAIKNGQKILLSEREYELLALLYNHKGVALSSAEIYEKVWGERYMPSSANTVMVHILNLRKKLEDDFTSPVHIQTIWGKGYCYVK